MNPLYTVLIYTVWFLSTYSVVLILLLLLNADKLYERKRWNWKRPPPVSIIVPAYNEAAAIADTIASLKQVTYPSVEFIIVNDGSKDRTGEIVLKHIRGDRRFIFLDNAKNKGKAACLNQGIARANGEYVACMDADSIVEPGILQKALPYFTEDRIGAVTVSVEVRNPKSFLHKIIDIEYLLGLSLFLKLFSKIDCIFVTPGPFSIYRKRVLDDIGGFDTANIVEDHEIAYRIHRAGYRIRNCLEARVKTALPETFKGLYVQRRRWYSGALHTMVQHRRMLLKPRYGTFSFFAPINQLLTLLGMALFIYTLYLGISNFADIIGHFRYAEFDLWERLLSYKFDMLALGKAWFFGTTSFIAGIILMALSLKHMGVSLKHRKLGILGYPFLFFLYQVFWIGSYIAFLRGGRVRWR